MAVLDSPNYVSIILVHYSQADEKAPLTEYRKRYLRKSIDSLEENTNYPAEIIVIDNGGEDDDSDYLLGKTKSGVINTYIRNKDNMFFGWAWNQGVKLATSDFIVLTCNDIEFLPNWLPKTLYPLLNFDKKIISSPINGKRKYDKKEIGDYYLNLWAGSDCMMMTKNIFNDIGEFTTHHLAGSLWQRKMLDNGYLVAVPKENHAVNLGGKKGKLNPKRRIQVKERLLGGEVDFSHPYNVKVSNKGHIR